MPDEFSLREALVRNCARPSHLAPVRTPSVCLPADLSVVGQFSDRRPVGLDTRSGGRVRRADAILVERRRLARLMCNCRLKALQRDAPRVDPITEARPPKGRLRARPRRTGQALLIRRRSCRPTADSMLVDRLPRSPAARVAFDAAPTRRVRTAVAVTARTDTVFATAPGTTTRTSFRGAAARVYLNENAPYRRCSIIRGSARRIRLSRAHYPRALRTLKTPCRTISDSIAAAARASTRRTDPSPGASSRTPPSRRRRCDCRYRRLALVVGRALVSTWTSSKGGGRSLMPSRPAGRQCGALRAATRGLSTVRSLLAADAQSPSHRLGFPASSSVVGRQQVVSHVIAATLAMALNCGVFTCVVAPSLPPCGLGSLLRVKWPRHG